MVRDLRDAGHEVVLFSHRRPVEESAGLVWAEGDIADTDEDGASARSATVGWEHRTTWRDELES